MNSNRPTTSSTRSAFPALVLLVLLVPACASIGQPPVKQTEDLLARSGFTKRSMDDPVVERHAGELPKRQLLRATQDDGSARWVFNDPRGCHCVYVGDDKAYGHYKDLVRSQAQYERVEGEHEAEGGFYDADRIHYEAQSGLW